MRKLKPARFSVFLDATLPAFEAQDRRTRLITASHYLGIWTDMIPREESMSAIAKRLLVFATLRNLLGSSARRSASRLRRQEPITARKRSTVYQHRDILRQKMPEESYSHLTDTGCGVRSFRRRVGHVAWRFIRVRAQAGGEAAPSWRSSQGSGALPAANGPRQGRLHRPRRAQTSSNLDIETLLYNFCSQGGYYCTDGIQPRKNIAKTKTSMEN